MAVTVADLSLQSAQGVERNKAVCEMSEAQPTYSELTHRRLGVCKTALRNLPPFVQQVLYSYGSALTDHVQRRANCADRTLSQIRRKPQSDAFWFE